MQPTSPIENPLEDGPAYDRYIDGFLSARDESESPMSDPLGREKIPSLGFEHETRGSYFIQVTVGDKMVSAWKIVGGRGGPDTYSMHVYYRSVFNGVTSWGNPVNGKQFVAQSLLQVQAIMHDIFTSGGNDGVER